MSEKKSISVKAAALLLAAGLVVGGTVGGTLAWLYDTTDPVQNTFTVGNIEITLDEVKVNEDGEFLDASGEVVTSKENAARVSGVTETEGTNKYQLIPGKTYTKDPTLTVTKGNEKCYLFVEFTETGDPSTYLTYDFLLDDENSGWTRGATGNGVDTNVWYKELEETDAATGSDTVIHLLKDDKIQVKDSVTKENMDTAAAAKLEWKAYAVQYWNDGTAFTAAQAWDIAKDGSLTSTDGN